MYLSNFKKFFEDNNPDYFQTGLGNELGMSWDDIVKVLENEPWVTSNLSLGSSSYKTGLWEIVPGSLTQYGASIRMKKNNKGYLKDKALDKTDGDDATYHLDRNQLISFLTQGWTPTQPS
jgi:hypothetical protein